MTTAPNQKVATNARWKAVYQEMFRKTPKNKRRTKHQIKVLRGKAKIYVRNPEQFFELYQ